MSKVLFKLRDALTVKNFICSGIPGMIETTINMPMITSLNMRITNGKVTWSLREFYRGWALYSPTYIPYYFVNFTVKNYLCSKFPYQIRGKDGKVTGIRFLRAIQVGAISGFFASITCQPIERILVYQNSNQVGIRDSLRSISGGQGRIKGMFTGYVGWAWLCTLFSVGLFSISDYLDNIFTSKCSRLIERYPSGGPVAVSTLSRFSSGVLIGFLTCPLNNARIYQQGIPANAPKMGFLDALKRLHYERRLMHGWCLRVGEIGLSIIWVRAAESMLRNLLND